MIPLGGLITLRDYQQGAVDAILSGFRRGLRRELLNLPTGSGKTVVMADIGRRARSPLLFLAHRDELITQAAEKMRMFWPEESIGVVKAGLDQWDRPVVLASVQTLSQLRRLERIPQDRFGLMMIDEVHHAVAASYRRIIEYFGFDVKGGKPLLGVTATPNRADDVGLGAIFEEIVYEKSILDLVRAGYLVDLKGLSVHTDVDLSGVRVVAGDFDERELGRVLNTANRNQIIVQAYLAEIPDRKALGFAATVEHARDLSIEFNAAGVSSAWVSGDMPMEQRRMILRDFREDRIRALWNFGVLTEGYDEPSIGAIIMARPTKSETLYRQCVGRGTRPWPGLDNCVIMDVADVSGKHDILALGDLFGLPVEALEKAKGSVLKAALKAEKDQAIKSFGPAAKGYRVEQFDLFDRSRFKWDRSGSWLGLDAGVGEKIWLVPDGDAYRVALRSRGRAEQLLADRLSLAYAQGVAEDYVRRNGREKFADKEAPWRQQPASVKQIAKIRELGGEAPVGLTKDGAGNLISRLSKKKKFEELRAQPDDGTPATEAQLRAIRKALKREPRRGITKLQAMILLDSIYSRERSGKSRGVAR